MSNGWYRGLCNIQESKSSQQKHINSLIFIFAPIQICFTYPLYYQRKRSLPIEIQIKSLKISFGSTLRLYMYIIRRKLLIQTPHTDDSFSSINLNENLGLKFVCCTRRTESHSKSLIKKLNIFFCKLCINFHKRWFK